MTNNEEMQQLYEEKTKEMDKMSNFLEDLKGKYMLIRTQRAGVFTGTIIDIKEGVEGEHCVVKLHNARRIWAWAGAATLSELATHGTSKPDECKFPCEMEEVILWGVMECIKVTDKAKTNIQNVPIWSATL